MTVFNGVDQAADVTGISSAVPIQINVTLSDDYPLFPPVTSYDCIVDGRAGAGNFLAEHLTGSSGTFTTSNCSIAVDGTSVSRLSADNAPAGSVIEITVPSGSNVDTAFSLFRQPGGFGALPISASLVEILDVTGTTVLHSFTLPTIVTSTTIVDSVGSASLELINFTVAAGPTITGPDTTTEGATTTQTGTLLDTVTTQSLTSGAYSIAQTIDAQTATELEYVAESGVNLCSIGNPVSGVPLEPTVTAAGITPYVVQQEADDGVNPPATRNITLNPEATHNVVQTMIAAANTTPGESFFGTNILGVENNHQLRHPKVVDTVTITVAADGTFETDKDQTISFNVEYFAPSTGEWYPVAVTVSDTSHVDVTSTIMISEMIQPMITNMIEDM